MATRTMLLASTAAVLGAAVLYLRRRRKSEAPREFTVLFYDRSARLCEPVKQACCAAAQGSGISWKFHTWKWGDSNDELRVLCASANAIVSGPGLPPETLQWATNLEVLQTATAGYEWVPFDKMPAGSCVCNTSSMDISIAEYVMLAILERQIGLSRSDATFREKRFFVPPFGAPGHPQAAPFHGEAHGKTLGIVGLGQIGEQVAVRAAAFGMRVLATTGRARPASEPLPAGVAWRGAGTGADLDALLKQSDFVLLCCALTEQSRGLMDVRRLALLQSHATLINVGRGGLIDEAALHDALHHRQLGGAVLDVWWRYPTLERPDTWPSELPFHELPTDRLVMTPHLSGWTAEQEVRKTEQMAANLEAVALGCTPRFLLRR